MLFLGIISWKGASRFNGEGGCFSDRKGFVFKWGCAPWGVLALMGGRFLKKIVGWGGVPPCSAPTMGNPVNGALFAMILIKILHLNILFKIVEKLLQKLLIKI